MNYYLKDICCFCLSHSNGHFNCLSSKNPNNFTYFKITTTLLGLSTVIESDSKICTKCCETIDFIYNFNKTCLNNIKVLSSYKRILKENMTKKPCDLYVNLSKFKQLKEEEISLGEVKIEPVDCFSYDYEKSLTEFVLKKDQNEELQIKEEKADNDSTNETFEIALLDSEMKREIETYDLKMEWPNEFDNGPEYASVQPTTEALENVSGQPPLENVQMKKESAELIECHYLQVEESSHEIQKYGESSKQNHSSVQEKALVQNPFECNICKISFSLNSNLQEHMKIHSDENPYKCLTCNKIFKYKMSLDNHILIHNSEKAHCCDQCDKRFIDETKLIEHQRTHSEEKPYKCDQCEKRFLYETHLELHLPVHSMKPFKCDICRRSFKFKCSLEHHMPVHSDERPFKCDICEDAFKYKTNLDQHMLTHTDEKPHKCLTCNKTFRYKCSLVNHKLIHSGEKPHCCDQCDKKFTEKSNLVKHKRLHTGEKLHKCDECGKAFVEKSKLVIHTRIHTGETPFSCNVCTKSFREGSALARHRRKHYGF